MFSCMVPFLVHFDAFMYDNYIQNYTYGIFDVVSIVLNLKTTSLNSLKIIKHFMKTKYNVLYGIWWASGLCKFSP